MRKFRYFLIVFFFLAITYSVFRWYPVDVPSQHTLAVKSETRAPLDATFQKLLIDYETDLTSLMANAQTPGAAVVIVKDSTVIFLKGFGRRHISLPDLV